MEKLMFYREWCRMYTLTNLEWEMEMAIEKHYTSSQITEWIEIYMNILKNIEDTYARGDVKCLKHFFCDILSEAKELDEPCKRIVNARLRAVCGEDLTKYDKRLANSVQRIVKRGKIRNDSEYEKVRTYIGCIECEPEPSPEHEELLQDLYRLVGDFEIAVGDDPSLVGEEWR